MRRAGRAQRIDRRSASRRWTRRAPVRKDE